MKNKPASSLVVSLGKALNRTPHFMWKTDDPEVATPKRVRTYRPKHSDTSLSREWRINMAKKNQKNIIFSFVWYSSIFIANLPECESGSFFWQNDSGPKN